MEPEIKDDAGPTSAVTTISKRSIAFFCVILLASTTLLLLQARKITDLRAVITELKAQGRLKPGTKVSAVKAVSRGGAKAEIGFGDSNVPTVLYVFSPQCVWCTRNLENLKALNLQGGGKYRLIGLSLSKTNLEEYVVRNQISFPVFADVEESSRVELKLGGTPQTLVVGTDSSVLYAWSGAYTGGLQSEIESALKIKLPGLPKEN